MTQPGVRGANWAQVDGVASSRTAPRCASNSWCTWPASTARTWGWRSITASSSGPFCSPTASSQALPTGTGRWCRQTSTGTSASARRSASRRASSCGTTRPDASPSMCVSSSTMPQPPSRARPQYWKPRSSSSVAISAGVVVIARQAEDRRAAAGERAAEVGIGGCAEIVADVPRDDDRVGAPACAERGLQHETQRHGRVQAVQLARRVAEQVRVGDLKQLEGRRCAPMIRARRWRLW